MSISSRFATLNPKNLVRSLLKGWLDKMLAEAGSVLDLDFSFKGNQLTTLLELNGESEPVSVTATGFLILADGTVTIRSVESTKPWLAVVLKKAADDGMFSIPEKHLNKLKYIKPLFR